MLNRRILRIKAFKTVYSYAENYVETRGEDGRPVVARSMTLKEAEALLDLSCAAARDLYLFLLAICTDCMQRTCIVQFPLSIFNMKAFTEYPCAI